MKDKSVDIKHQFKLIFRQDTACSSLTDGVGQWRCVCVCWGGGGGRAGFEGVNLSVIQWGCDRQLYHNSEVKCGNTKDVYTQSNLTQGNSMYT